MKHVLAMLRDVIELKQDGFHEIIGCSLSAVVQIEAGTLKLSERLAERISLATGVGVGWLLANDTSRPPIGCDGAAYTKEKFDAVQAEQMRPKSELVDCLQVLMTLNHVSQKAAAILAGAFRNERTSLCAYKLHKALDGLMDDFGVKWGDPKNPLTSSVLDPKDVFDLFQSEIRAAFTKNQKSQRAGAFVISGDGQITNLRAKPKKKK